MSGKFHGQKNLAGHSPWGHKESGKAECLTPGTSQLVLVVKSLPAKTGDINFQGSVPGLGRSPGEGNGNPLQYSYMENPMDRGVKELNTSEAI